MSGHLTEAPRHMSKRGMALLAALATMVAMSFALSAAPNASAQTQVGFCTSVWLAPYGQAGDRCMQGQGAANNYHTFAVNTYARAGCVAPAEYWGVQVDNWVCAGQYSIGLYYMPASKPSGWYRGFIRNNNTANAATFGGVAGCCRPW